MKHTHLLKLALALLFTTSLVYGQAAGYWHTYGNQILDSTNQQVRISGVNWYGFETTDEVVHGLWAQDYKSILNTIHSNGYNTIRIPFSNQMVESPIVPSNISFNNNSGAINTDLQGLNSLQILDKIVLYAGQIGLHIILDNHRSEAGNSAESNGLWYTSSYPESSWINDWVALANRYKGNSVVIGMDLRNEPHNATSGGSCWGCGSTTNDWRLAAQRAGNSVLSTNPNLLIFVEGTDCYNGDCDWWGGNLEGANSYPVILNHTARSVYSAHDYGPTVYGQSWFNNSTSYSSLSAVWTKFWAYLSQNGVAPVWLGEFGTTNNAADIANSTPGSEGQWFQSMISFLSTNPNLSWTYWALNGEDSLALLDNNYDSTPANAAKQQALASIQFNSSGSTVPPCQAIPTVPQALSATSGSASAVSLTWTESNSPAGCAVSYNIYQGKTPNFTASAASLVKSGVNTLNYAVTGLAASTTYYFSVSALDAAGQSAASIQASATTPAASAMPPVAPTNLIATASSSSAIQLSWQASSTAGVTYNLYRSETAGFSPSSTTRIATGIAAINYLNTGLTASTLYYYVVTAFSGGMESGGSGQASATSQNATPTNAACHVVYTLNSQWNTGFNVSITVQNTGSTTINSWSLTWNWSGNQVVSQAWNSNLVNGGPNVLLTSASWNGTIAPGSTINGIGFNGTYSGNNPVPTSFYLNGSLCK